MSDYIPHTNTLTYTIENFAFSTLTRDQLIDIYWDGRTFSRLSEVEINNKYEMLEFVDKKHHDFIHKNNDQIKYEQKTFTQRGCKCCPSAMVGAGRSFDLERFTQIAGDLIYIIVSNVNFPEIKIKFIHGRDLIEKYPTGQIPSKDHDEFFN